jgi:hypothetical protein
MKFGIKVGIASYFFLICITEREIQAKTVYIKEKILCASAI